MDNSYILFEEIVGDSPPLSFSGPKVNLTNYHSGVWAVFHVIATDDEFENTEVKDILIKARDALDEHVTPKMLYDRFEDEITAHTLDPYNMKVYAKIIISMNEKMRTKPDAQ